MKSYHLALAAAGISAGCNNIETALIIQHAAAGSDTCAFDEDGTDFRSAVYFDAANSDTLALELRVINTLQGGMINFGSDIVPDNFRLPNSVIPTRFDLRWECDANGFSDDLGDLFVPQFSAQDPFCISDDTRTFAGFDVIPASGNTIQPDGDVGLVRIQPVTAQLGQAFADVFELAKQAQRCCDSAMSCSDAALQQAPDTPGTPCGDLQIAFDTIAGPGKLSAKSFADIQKFRPFLIFDHLEVTPKVKQVAGPGYPLRLRGVLEGVTASGSIVSSTEWSIEVFLCANCPSTPCTNF